MPEPWFTTPLALTPPKEKAGGFESIVPLPTFSLELLKIDRLKMELGMDKSYSALENLRNLYKGMLAGEKTGEMGTHGIRYSLNAGLTKSPLEVLTTRKGDCDEITRLAFLTASQLGIQNITMVEMTWTNPKTKQFEGHSAIVLMPENPLDAPLVFDFTYLRNGVPLESANLERGLKKLYGEDAMNPDFKITKFETVAEVGASYYDKVGKFYAQTKNWGMTAQAYERAGSLVPDNFEYNRALAFSYKKANRPEESMKFYKIASETVEGKQNAEIYANIGELCITLHREDEAIDMLLLALGLKPQENLNQIIHGNLATIYFNNGVILENEGNPHEALDQFERALMYTPDDSRIKKAIKRIKTEGND